MQINILLAFVKNDFFLQIPNFFHLTPIAVERHCAALKCELLTSDITTLELEVMCK